MALWQAGLLSQCWAPLGTSLFKELEVSFEGDLSEACRIIQT